MQQAHLADVLPGAGTIDHALIRCTQGFYHVEPTAKHNQELVAVLPLHPKDGASRHMSTLKAGGYMPELGDRKRCEERYLG